MPSEELRIVALVPMRHHSERVPGKNYRPFAQKPLFHYILQTLSDCPQISAIAVDTDSPIIMDGLRADFPQVHIIERPEALRAGTVPMNDILMHDTQQIEADFYLQTHSTNPLLRSQTVGQAIAQFLANYPMYDSLFGVTRVQSRFWDQTAMPINHNPNILLRTQDLPPIFEENSNLYIFTRDILQRKRNRIGDRPLMFEIDRQEALDIDEEIDFKVAELMYLSRLKEDSSS